MATEIELSGRKAAVTGAGGFIGAAVCRRLVAEGCAVTGLDIDEGREERVRSTGATFAVADVSDAARASEALAGAELIVHTAAIVSDLGEMADFVKVNVGGTRNVLDAAEAGGAERVVHVSSVVVYGYDDPAEQDEDAFRRTYGIPYIDTKTASDRIACTRGAIVVRPGDVYGPESVSWAIRPVEMAKAGQLALPRGERMMLPVYIDDLAESIALALRRGRPGRAYTVWDGSRVTFEDLWNRYARLVGGREARRLPRAVTYVVGAGYEALARLRGEPPPFGRYAATLVDRRGTVSNRRAREELGWEPHVNFDLGMRRTEEWLRAEGHV